MFIICIDNIFIILSLNIINTSSSEEKDEATRTTQQQDSSSKNNDDCDQNQNLNLNLLSIVKEMSPNVKEVIYNKYKDLCQVKLEERLLELYGDDTNDNSWFDNAEPYNDGPIIDELLAVSEGLQFLLLGPGEDGIQVYKIVIDNLEGLEVVVMRYGNRGRSVQYINAFFDVKTHRPLLFDFSGNKIQPSTLYQNI